MHILLSFFLVHFELRLSKQEIFFHLLLGSRTLFLYEKEFAENFKCAECNQEVEGEAQLLKLCDDHRDQFIETWYSRWMSKK